jgi:hypothetical protein
MFLALSQVIVLVTSQSANLRKVLGAIGLGSQLRLAEKMFVTCRAVPKLLLEPEKCSWT